jgi:hypothetical protein
VAQEYSDFRRHPMLKRQFVQVLTKMTKPFDRARHGTPSIILAAQFYGFAALREVFRTVTVPIRFFTSSTVHPY